ncbi:MAG: sugar ABC transporter substrate-binding protein [Sulfurospirillum sp.]
MKLKFLVVLSIVLGMFLGANSALAKGLKGAPPPFNGSKKIHVALIRQMTEGEFMQTYRAGAQIQANLLGIKLTVFGKSMDNQAEANFVYQAINMKVDGIIIDHGLSETMMKPAADAIKAGIPVVAFDVDLKNPKITQIAQDDELLGMLALKAMVKDFNGKANVGYVSIAGILPLDKRDRSWRKIKKEYPGIKEIVKTGTLESPIAAKNADQVKAVLLAHPEINAFFAPYDELGKGVVQALREARKQDKVKVYTADISTQDIREMIKPDSPWAATAATNPASIGAVSLRAIALEIAGIKIPHNILIPPMLFTAKELRKMKIKNMKQLRAKFPKFNSVDLLNYSWIPVDKKGLF